MWPFRKREAAQEDRSTAQGYTASLTAAFVSGAEGGAQGTPLATAALEAAAGLYASCFAAATLEPDIPALTAEVRALLARNLIRRGEDFHRIYVRDGRLVLSPIGFAYAHGNDPDPLGWIYNVTLYGPTDSRHEWTPAASILHSRYSTDASRPWLGVPPWSWAASAGRLAGYTEERLGDDASGNVARVVPMPAAMVGAGAADKLAALKTDMSTSKGKAFFLPTTSDGGGEGRVAAPARDWKQERIGPEPPETMLTLRSDSAQALLAACGVPLALVDAGGAGTGQRESWRRFVMGPLAGLARCVEDEIARKLDVRARFDFSALWAHDVAGRASSFKAIATAYKIMKEADMDPAAAAALAGLMD